MPDESRMMGLALATAPVSSVYVVFLADVPASYVNNLKPERGFPLESSHCWAGAIKLKKAMCYPSIMRYGLLVAFITAFLIWGVKAAFGGAGIFALLGVLIVIHVAYYLVTGRRLE